MPEAIDYIQTLRERGLPVAYRELRSRLWREPPRKSIARLLDVLARHRARFTFFVVGAAAREDRDLVRRMIDEGHELASHGFHHHRFDALGFDRIVQDLEACRRLFAEEFQYELRGFRAPYLRMNESVARALRKAGFAWSSSVERGPAAAHECGLPEFPVDLDDWSVLIKEKKDRAGLLEAMKARAEPGAVFLLHPWRVGQPAYVGALEAFLRELPHPAVTLSELAAGRPGIALSGDIGEFSTLHLVARALRPAVR